MSDARHVLLSPTKMRSDSAPVHVALDPIEKLSCALPLQGFAMMLGGSESGMTGRQASGRAAVEILRGVE